MSKPLTHKQQISKVLETLKDYEEMAEERSQVCCRCVKLVIT